MNAFRLITLVAMVCMVSCTLGEPVFSLSANGNNVPVIEFDAKYDYAVLSCDGACKLEVTRLDGKPIEQYTITPQKLGIRGNVSGANLKFQISNPQYLILDIEGLRKLVIAIDPPETEKPAATGAGVFNVASYGNDVQRAANEAGKAGGIVYVPDGVYELPALELASNVSLYLEPGAVLRCAGRREELKGRYHKSSQNRDGTWFIYTAAGASNVKIFGRGTIDGNGKHLVETLNLSNHLLVPLNCSNFTIDGVVLRDSGLWGTVVANSKNVTLRNTKHFNHLDMGEDDCVDICNSQHVRVQRSIAISLDDPYSTKTWQPGTDLTRQWPGEAQANRDITFDDCVSWSRCFAFKIGAGVWRDQENITIRNSVVYDSAHAIGISHSYGSADVRNVLFDTIDVERNLMNNLGRSWARIVIDPRKPGAGDGGGVYDVRIRNVTVRDAGAEPCRVAGMSESKKIDGVTFENIRMPGRDAPASTLAELGVTETKFAENVRVAAGERDFDVVVYGATSGGVSAAVQAARMGKRVVLIEPGRHVGGMTSGGLGWTDVGSPEIVGGMAREFFHRVYLHYQSDAAWKFGTREQFADAPAQGIKAVDSAHEVMWIFEPHVAEKIFADMLRETNVTVLFGERLDRAHGVVKDGPRIVSIRTESGATFTAKIFIDATYEGDLMAAAGVGYVVGREANSVYGETINGIQTAKATKNQLPDNLDPFVVKGDPTSGLLAGVNRDAGGEDGAGDSKAQAYCYRMCLTDVPENRVAIEKPEGYDEKQYELLVRAIEAGQTDRFFKLNMLPNRKTDSNNDGGISTDLIGQNYAYPDADDATREKLAKAHELWQRGLLWTLQNHPRVPAPIRAKFAKWGLPRDEFTDTDHWPHQLYIREARRMVGETVATERTVIDDNASRPVALGGYSMDSHNVQRHVDAAGHVRNEGDVQIKVPHPYRIDYGVMLPKSEQCTNLLVPFCVSASHAAFSTIRMEPVFMELGQCAGTATCMAIDEDSTVLQVPYAKLRLRLLKDGAILDWEKAK